jgi:O-antigen ligase
MNSVSDPSTRPPASVPAPVPTAVATVAASLAVSVPALLAFNPPPSATFMNQAAAMVGWGAWLVLVVASSTPARATPGRGLRALLAALLLLALAALATVFWAHLPSTIGLSAAGLLAATALTALIAASARRGGQTEAVFAAFGIGLTIAGVLSAVIGLVQVFAPALTGNDWIAATTLEGRAVGNLRQPNHLSSLLLWSMIAAVWLADAKRLPRAVAEAAMLPMLFCLVLTGSRTGMLGTLLLAAWGLLDRRLSRRARGALLLVPVLYAVFWFGMAEWAHLQGGVFSGETRLQGSDISSSRFAIWKNTVALILAHPWAGVGFGEFNFAWSLTPFPDRPGAFFDHTHNLPLQFAVELGLPLAVLVLVLLTGSLCSAWRHAQLASDAEALALRAALVMVFMIVLHSQLEYPLWYAYFLLPAAFALGLCLGGTPQTRPAATPGSPRLRPMMIGALLLMSGGFASVLDYHRVVVIFAPSEDAPPLEERIAAGRRSVFFGHHADYAAATSAPDPAAELPAFETATHYLLDTRLMLAWAQALAASGDIERARHIAQRLREFHNPASDEFFAACLKPPADAASAPPFQCAPPTRAFDYRDFR